jgi:DNA-binding MarR family transcriptional regulator
MLNRQAQIESFIGNFHAIYQAMVKGVPSILNELNITYTQMLILGFVKENEGISLKKLAATMGITSSAATQQVNNLVKRGCLVREESNVDRRLVNIRLSGQMDKQIEVIKARFLGQLFTFFTGITDEELALCCKLHSRIANKILQR